jgi:demethylmenaquinone methyltransferase/2-methoxy-6-polyprenyl-1,4-benzoquinol methylase
MHTTQISKPKEIKPYVMVKSFEVRKRYNRYSYIYDLVEAPMEHLLFHRWRRQLFSQVSGRVLEVGIGTGRNIPHYTSSVVGIDISEGMLRHAKHRARDHVELVLMDATSLGFKDNSFDFVITTFVLCSVPDPIATLKEMRRVCKRDGYILMLEHVKSSNPLISLLEELLNPVTSTLFGFNVNRDTPENIVKAGLHVVEDNRLALRDVFRLIKAKKQGHDT